MKPARYKPRLVFVYGWWRVLHTDDEVAWRDLRAADQQRRAKAYEHVRKLNETPEAKVMRAAYYSRRKAPKTTGPEYKAKIMAILLANRLSS